MRFPVVQTLGDKISDVRIRYESDWCTKHLELLHANYRNADYFEEVYSDFSRLLATRFEYISDLNISIIDYICKRLVIPFNFVKSSDLKIRTIKEEKILDICNSLDCDIYYSGTGAKAYQVEDNFTSRGIQLRYSEYKVFQYPQQFSGFQSNVTILDFLMNCGYNWDMVLSHQQESLNGDR